MKSDGNGRAVNEKEEGELPKLNLLTRKRVLLRHTTQLNRNVKEYFFLQFLKFFKVQNHF